MYFVQFFQLSTGYIAGTIPPQFGEKKPVEATGDRGVIVLDGRESRNTMHAFAESECNKRGFVGWQLFKGETFTRSSPISELIHSR